MGSPGIGEDEGTEYNDGQEGFGENGDKAWGDEPGEIIQGVQGFGARWDWVVVLQVKGRGKGVVGRAERVIRQWVCSSFFFPIDVPDRSLARSLALEIQAVKFS